jgi:serine/threonine protein phosphatase 1
MEATQPQSTDTIVCLGDVIDYGPDSKGVVEQLIALHDRTNLIFVRGNHEEMLLAIVDGTSSLECWTQHGGDDTLASYGANHPREIPGNHLELIRRSKLFWETEENIFVHAGYYPNQPLKDIPANVLFWEFLEPKRAWPHYSDKTVFVGHTPQTTGDILDLGFLVCIDTDCSRGGWLTGLDMTTGHYWQANERGEVREGDRR